MAIPSLLNAARPAAVKVGGHPPAGARRHVELKSAPGVAALGMLQHPAEFAHGRQRGSEAAAVVAQLEPRECLWRAAPIAAPALARRMRDDRMRTIVEPGIALSVPRVYVGKAVICSASLDEKRGDHARPR